MKIHELRKAASAVYLAAEEGPARDLSEKLSWAANIIESLKGYAQHKRDCMFLHGNPCSCGLLTLIENL